MMWHLNTSQTATQQQAAVSMSPGVTSPSQSRPIRGDHCGHVTCSAPITAQCLESLKHRICGRVDNVPSGAGGDRKAPPGAGMLTV